MRLGSNKHLRLGTPCALVTPSWWKKTPQRPDADPPIQPPPTRLLGSVVWCLVVWFGGLEVRFGVFLVTLHKNQGVESKSKPLTKGCLIIGGLDRWFGGSLQEPRVQIPKPIQTTKCTRNSGQGTTSPPKGEPLLITHSPGGYVLLNYE